ncbi:MAG: NUDIX domain-containing protein [Chitinophagaceae bacterium]
MKLSAGILLYKLEESLLRVFLVHPGGPFWKNKDAGAWSIPKGEFTDEEQPLEAAKREFNEETGIDISGDFMELSPIQQKSGKKVLAWAVEGDIDPSALRCNTFTMEWPPKSGKWQHFPEVDQGAWFSAGEAKEKIVIAQAPFIDELQQKLR